MRKEFEELGIRIGDIETTGGFSGIVEIHDGEITDIELEVRERKPGKTAYVCRSIAQGTYLWRKLHEVLVERFEEELEATAPRPRYENAYTPIRISGRVG